MFLEEFLSLISVLSSCCTELVICEDFNIHLDRECRMLDCCRLAELVHSPTHLHRHIIELILTPSDSNFLANVWVGQFVLDNALIKCQLDFTCPPRPNHNCFPIAIITKLTCSNSEMICTKLHLSVLLLQLLLIFTSSTCMTLVLC